MFVKLSPNEVAWCAQQAGFAGFNLQIAVAVAWAESRGDTDALGHVDTSPNFDHGLWQISSKWHGAKLAANQDWRNPYTNARLARMVFDETAKAKGDGWKAWATYVPTGTKPAAYLEWMDEAALAVLFPFAPVMPAVDANALGKALADNLHADVDEHKLAVELSPLLPSPDLEQLAKLLAPMIAVPPVMLDPADLVLRLVKQ